MSVRSGMTNIIRRLRRLVNDGTAGVWEDQDLQDVLDQHKIHVVREYLEPQKNYLSGTAYEYRLFASRWADFEENGSGTAYLKLEDGGGSQRTYGTATAQWTMDYIRGLVTMGQDQAGTAMYLTGWSYDLNGAAAELWRERAGQVASFYDVQADGHRLSRSQWMTHCLKMADEMDKRARPVTVHQWTQGVFEHE